MSPGKNCPSCGRDIGVLPIFSAGLPNRIWCPHCKARLRYRDTLALMMLVLAIAVVMGVGAFFATRELVPAGWRGLPVFGIFMLIFGGGWCVVELVLTWFLRRWYELEIVKPPSLGTKAES
jgi:hypothetical protein